MLTDASLAFVPIGAPLSLVGGAGVPIASGVIDLLGVGVGVAPPSIIGNVAVYGAADAMGVGKTRPELQITVGVAAATATAATLNVALQAAPDQGAGGGYQPGAWQTLAESGQLTAAQLTALANIFRVPWLPPFPANLRPRFLRLLFSPLAATSFTAGTIASALVTAMRDDQFNKYAAKNFVA